VNTGNQWNSRTSTFDTRLDLNEILGAPDALSLTDVADPRLALIQATVAGASDIDLGEGTSTDQLAGNNIEMLKAYAERLAALDQSYFTYSYYSTEITGKPVLAAVAVNRVSGTVEHADELLGGIYYGGQLAELSWRISGEYCSI
jgi:hypothetical protein